jgi:hypothetical protein
MTIISNNYSKINQIMEQEINDKVQKINDEDYEIIKVIETKTYPGSIKWYKDSYSCDLEEAIEAIDAIKNKYGVNHVGLYTSIDKEELILMYDIMKLVNTQKISDTSEIRYADIKADGLSFLEKWIMSKTGFSQDKASEMRQEAQEEWLKRQPNQSSGCLGMIIMLIISILSFAYL